VHLLAACLVPMSYCARVQAESFFLLAIHIVRDFKSDAIPQTLRKLITRHVAMAVPVVLAQVVGEYTLLVGAMVTYALLWGHRSAQTHVVPSLPASLRAVLTTQPNTDAPLELCFLVLWATWICAHVNASYFVWLLAPDWFSPLKIVSAFVMSFNAVFSCTLMVHLLLDHDVFTTEMVATLNEGGGEAAVAGDARVAMLWVVTLLVFVLYEHIWPFAWVWELVAWMLGYSWTFVGTLWSIVRGSVQGGETLEPLPHLEFR
jgi:hypothetical protein